MGSTNHGTQEITYEYFEEATAEDFNKRHLDIRPRGIYIGGHFTRINNAQITLSAFTAEIGDAAEQINVKTAAAATITAATLDSGNLNSGTPFIVLRWAFVAQQNNYVEIHAVASVAVAQANDIIVGKVVFAGAVITGFDYTDRTLLSVQDVFLRVEATETTEMRVWVRRGKIQTASQCIEVAEQKTGLFIAPGAPNSRIDLVYLDSNGVPQILQGSASPSPSAPNYGSKLVLAEVRVVQEDTNISSDRITDVRAFITGTPDTSIPANSVTSTELKTYDSGWFAVGLNTTYTKAHGLGSIPFMIQLWIGDTPTGSGKVVVGCAQTAINAYGTNIVDVDVTNIKIRALAMLANVIDANGSLWQPTSGYARIKAIR